GSGPAVIARYLGFGQAWFGKDKLHPAVRVAIENSRLLEIQADALAGPVAKLRPGGLHSDVFRLVDEALAGIEIQRVCGARSQMGIRKAALDTANQAVAETNALAEGAPIGLETGGELASFVELAGQDALDEAIEHRVFAAQASPSPMAKVEDELVVK